MYAWRQIRSIVHTAVIPFSDFTKMRRADGRQFGRLSRTRRTKEVQSYVTHQTLTGIRQERQHDTGGLASEQHCLTTTGDIMRRRQRRRPILSDATSTIATATEGSHPESHQHQHQQQQICEASIDAVSQYRRKRCGFVNIAIYKAPNSVVFSSISNITSQTTTRRH